MSIDSILLPAGNHAIVNVQLGLDWSFSLDDAELERIKSSLVNELLNSQNFSEEIQNQVQFEFSPDNFQSQRSRHTKNGYLFTSKNDNSSKRIVLSRTGFILAQSIYTNWASLFEFYSALQKEVVNNSDVAKSIKTVSLHYVDKFILSQKNDDFDLSTLLKSNRFLASNAFQCTSAWHSHHGYLSKEQNPIPYQRVDNININAAMEDGRFSYTILSLHQASEFDLENLDTIKILESIQNDFHNLNKSIIRELLTADVQKKIGLHGAQDK